MNKVASFLAIVSIPAVVNAASFNISGVTGDLSSVSVSADFTFDVLNSGPGTSSFNIDGSGQGLWDSGSQFDLHAVIGTSLTRAFLGGNLAEGFYQVTLNTDWSDSPTPHHSLIFNNFGYDFAGPLENRNGPIDTDDIQNDSLTDSNGHTYLFQDELKLHLNIPLPDGSGSGNLTFIETRVQVPGTRLQ